MRALYLLIAVGAHNRVWALLDARSVLRGSNRRLSTANLGQLKLTAADDGWKAFGRSVAIDGDTIVIGASFDGATWTGAVYVFRTTDGGATYVEVAKLAASDGAAGDWFGWSVAIDGDTVVIGAYGKDSQRGSAYVFRTSDGGATYGQVAKLTGSDVASADYFGSSVAIDGDTVVIGTVRDCVYIFRTTDGGATYGQVAKLTASDAAAGDYFGISVAIAGGTFVVGTAYGNAAYVFLTSDDGASYAQVAKLTGPDSFGGSVAIDGDTVVIGANSDTHDGGSYAGSAYVYRTSDGWDTHTEIKLTASDGAADDAFGSSVAIDGTTVVVGAGQDDDAGFWSGSVYVFNTTDGGATYAQVAKLTAADAAKDDWFGWSVAIDGDVVVVGSDNEAAYIFSPTVATAESPTAALGSDSATRAGGTFLALLVAAVLAL